MPNFPGSIDDDVSLFLAANNARTSLTSNISDSDLTIPVVTTSGFPNTGFLTILSDPDDITKAEAISYVGVTLTTFSGVLRGAGGTTAASHGSLDNVDLTVIAEHHNELKDAVIALETFVGTTSAEKFLPQDTSGNVLITGTLNVPDTITAGISLTISGVPVTTGTIGDPFVLPDDITVSGIVAGSGIFTDLVIATGTVGELTVTGDLIGFDGSFTNSLTVSGIPVVVGEPLFPNKETISFTTVTVAGQGGSENINEPGFNIRSLVRKLKVTPTDFTVEAFQIDFYINSSFAENKLEYRATATGTFIDNATWFHEDEDSIGELHLRIINNATNDSTFTIELTSEAFS